MKNPIKNMGLELKLAATCGAKCVGGKRNGSIGFSLTRDCANSSSSLPIRYVRKEGREREACIPFLLDVRRTYVHTSSINM